MNDPLVSVIVLSYNNLQYSKDCLESIISQDYANIEIVFSDDSSDNFNMTEIKNFIEERKKNNIKNVIINQNNINLGIVKNYNNAIKASNGKYIFYIGVDDMFWSRDVLSDVVKFFQQTSCLILTGYRCLYDVTMTQYCGRWPTRKEVGYIKCADTKCVYEKLCHHNFIGGSATPFSRELIEKYGYLDETYKLLEDYPRYLSLSRKGCRFYFIDRPLIKYRLGGITNNGQINKLLEEDLKTLYIKEILPYKNSLIN